MGVFDDYGDSPWHVPACFSTAAAVFEDGILSLIPISYGHRISVGRLPKAEPGSECPWLVLDTSLDTAGGPRGQHLGIR